MCFLRETVMPASATCNTTGYLFGNMSFGTQQELLNSHPVRRVVQVSLNHLIR